MDNNDGNESNSNAIDVQRRLKKAVIVAEQYKNKYRLEQEINKELAKRIDKLKTELNEKHDQLKQYEDCYSNLRNKINNGYDVTINDFIINNKNNDNIHDSTHDNNHDNNHDNTNTNDNTKNKTTKAINNNIENDNTMFSSISLTSSHSFDNFIINNRKSWNQSEHVNDTSNKVVKNDKGVFLGYENLARSFDSKHDDDSKDDDDDDDVLDAGEIPIFDHFLIMGAEESAIKSAFHTRQLTSLSMLPMSPGESSFKDVKAKIGSVFNGAFSGKSSKGMDTINKDEKFMDANLLYHFPKCDPPSSELYDFSLPTGATVTSLQNHHDKEASIQEILYGSSQTQRSSKCFFYVLEDKTISQDSTKQYSDIGLDSNRLYGICVVYSRLIGNNDSNQQLSFDYEASVCYCFITRFPLFDFFFQLIYDMISMERIDRMESISQTKLDSYKYIPSNILDEMLAKLLRLKPPLCGSNYSFQGHPAIRISTYNRAFPPLNYEEYLHAATEWSLPVLLSWMPIETIVIAVGLLLCEVKIIVLGTEPGIVTSSVFGLLGLLRPLIWVSPIIPVLPTKYLDLVESPVPIISGIVAESKSKIINAETLLKKCTGTGNYTIAAVFDTTDREIYISQDNYTNNEEYILPQINILLEKLHSNIVEKKHFLRKEEPFYNYTTNQEKYSKSVQAIILCHVEQILNLCLSKNINSSRNNALSSSVESYSKLIEEKLSYEYIVTSSPNTSIQKGTPDSQKSMLSLASRYLPSSKISTNNDNDNTYNYDINSFMQKLTSTQQYMQFNK